jgi:uncharacterized membrane protein
MRYSNILVSLQKKVWIFPALALAALVIGQICAKACAFIRGDILGLDLNILGIVFYTVLFALAVLHAKVYPKEWLMGVLAAMSSIGMGTELILIKFQVQHGVYCPKCLISGFFFVTMFFMVAPRLKKWVVILLVCAGVLFATFTFSGSVIPSYAAEVRSPVFGNEKAQTEIIVYSDYFCPACESVDHLIHAGLRKMKDKAKIRFVDVPLHAGSLDYAEVFLYTWFESGNNLETAIRAREILFDAAKTKIDQKGVLNALKAKGIPFRADTDRAKEIFRGIYNFLMTQDKISATPTMVIVKGTERKSYTGGKEISRGLEEISGSQGLQ